MDAHGGCPDDTERADHAAEADLARRARERDASAWTEIFDRHFRTVFLFVRYRVRDSGDAEDIASQAFEVAYRNADRFDYRGVPVEGWLLGIARNLVRDHAKKLGRRGFTEEFAEETAVVTAPDELGRVDVVEDLSRAFRHLTEDQQTVLALRFLEDRSVEETAHLMARSEDAVKNLQRRALGALHRLLTGTSYAEGRG